MSSPSQVSGPRQPALLEETIGDCLRRIAGEHARARGAGLLPPGHPHDLRAAGRRGRPPRAGACWPAGLQTRRPRRDLEPELRRVDAGPAGHRAGGDRPRQHQPGLPHQRAGLRAQPVGLPGAAGRAGVQELRLRGDDRRGARRAAHRRAGDLPRRGVVGRAAGRRPTTTRRCRSCRRPTRSTSSTPAGRRARPRARRSATATSSTTATSSGPAAATRPPTASASRCPSTTASAWSWATSARSPTARRWSSPRRRSTRRPRWRRWPTERCTEPLRRADDVHRRARPSRLRPLRPDLAAHRDHGRLAVPGRGDEARHRRHAHGRGDHRLRHDRDLAGVDPDRGRRPASTSASAPSGACTRTSR